MTRWLVSVFGYLLYTLVLLVVLLWWRFPAAEVATWCGQRLDRLYPGLNWQVDALKWRFPNRFLLQGIQAQANDKPGMQVIRVPELTLTLDPLSLARKNLRISYSMNLYDGAGTGRIYLTWAGRFTCQGRFVNLDLHKMAGLATALNRSVQGRADATFSWQGTWPDMDKTKISGMVTVSKGLLPLRKPVLGLTILPFSRFESRVEHREQAWQLDRGRLEAKTMKVTFSGRIVPGKDLAGARLSLSGSLVPRAELFRATGKRDMATVVRGFLRNGALRFTVSGTAADPAVQFPVGLSRAMRRFHPRGGGTR